MSFLTVITGTMKGGKSEHLLGLIRLSIEHNRTFLVIKPSLDTRDGDCVRSRATDYYHKAVMVDEKSRMTTHLVIEGLKYFEEVFIDEAQFFSVEFIKAIESECNNYGVDLTVSGLMYDFLDKPFPSMDYLFDYANEDYFYQADCDECKMPDFATKNIRVINGVVQQVGSAIAVEGDGVEYKTVCQSCFRKLIK